MASTKARRRRLRCRLPPAGRKLIRELLYNIFYVDRPRDALLRARRPRLRHGPRATRPQRNIIGVIRKVGPRDRRRGDQVRAKPPELISRVDRRQGRSTPVLRPPRRRGEADHRGASASASRRSPATWSSSPSSRLRRLRATSCWPTREYVDLILNGAVHPPDLLHGPGRRAKPARTSTTGRCASWTRRRTSSASTRRSDYLEHIAEHVEPWSYLKFPLPQAGRLEGVRGRQASRASTAPRR